MAGISSWRLKSTSLILSRQGILVSPASLGRHLTWNASSILPCDCVGSDHVSNPYRRSDNTEERKSCTFVQFRYLALMSFFASGWNTMSHVARQISQLFSSQFRPASNHVQDTLRFGRFPVEFQGVTAENSLHDVQRSREFLQQLRVRFSFLTHAFIIHVGDVTHNVGRFLELGAIALVRHVTPWSCLWVAGELRQQSFVPWSTPEVIFLRQVKLAMFCAPSREDPAELARELARERATN